MSDGDDRAEPELPPPSLPSLPSVPASAPPPAPAPVTTGTEPDVVDPWSGRHGTEARVPADELATRHVPTTRRSFDLGLPTEPATPETASEFERPELNPMGDAIVAMLVGRVLIAVAALVVGIAARRSTGPRPFGRSSGPPACSRRSVSPA